MSFKKTTLTEIQKQDFYMYAQDNSNKTQAQYIDWIEEQWALELVKILSCQKVVTAPKSHEIDSLTRLNQCKPLLLISK